MDELNEKDKQIEQLLIVVKQQNEQIECLTDLCKNSCDNMKEVTICHNKSFTHALIATLSSIAVIVCVLTAMWLIYENQFTYSSTATTNTVSAEGTEANAQYVNGDYINGTEKGSEK